MGKGFAFGEFCFFFCFRIFFPFFFIFRFLFFSLSLSLPPSFLPIISFFSFSFFLSVGRVWLWVCACTNIHGYQYLFPPVYMAIYYTWCIYLCIKYFCFTFLGMNLSILYLYIYLSIYSYIYLAVSQSIKLSKLHQLQISSSRRIKRM